MFWSKERTVRVELLSPPVVVTTAAVPASPNTDQETKSSGFPFNLDQSLKLAAIMVAVVNTSLVVMGYMRYVDLLQEFGISRIEVAFSISDLLSFGYISFLNMTLSGQLTVAIVTSSITLLVAPIVVRFKQNLPELWQYMLIWTIAAGVFFLVTIPYWLAYKPGKESALQSARSGPWTHYLRHRIPMRVDDEEQLVWL